MNRKTLIAKKGMKGEAMKGEALRSSGELAHRRGKGRKRATGVLLGVVSALAIVFPAATAGAKTLTPLQRGLNFYQGKTITLVLGAAAGSAQDIQNRSLVPTMETYLHATINVENISTASGITAYDQVAQDNPNGLTFGLLKAGVPLYAIATNSPALNFNPEHVVFLGGYPNPASPEAMVTLPASHFSSVADLRSATAANPVSICSVLSSSSTAETNLFLHVFGISARLVTGYSGSTAAISGLERGDCDATVSTINGFPSEVSGGIFDAVWVNQRFTGASKDDVEESLIRSVPTIPELVKQFPLKTQIQKRALSVWQAFDAGSGNVFDAPSRTPNPEVLALESAIKHGINSPAVKASFNQQGDIIGFVPGPQAKEAYIKALAVVENSTDRTLMTTP